MEIREFAFGSDDYQQSLQLREAVLRIPLGFKLFEKDVADDAVNLHIGAFDNSRLLGVLLLRKISESTVQMRQVAVDPKTQGQGIGRELVDAFEKRARSLGATEVIMDARLSARPFYEKLGYTVVSEEFIQSTIPHFKMKKHL